MHGLFVFFILYPSTFFNVFFILYPSTFSSRKEAGFTKSAKSIMLIVSPCNMPHSYLISSVSINPNSICNCVLVAHVSVSVFIALIISGGTFASSSDFNSQL